MIFDNFSMMGIMEGTQRQNFLKYLPPTQPTSRKDQRGIMGLEFSGHSASCCTHQF
jgi:hypothetical protein